MSPKGPFRLMTVNTAPDRAKRVIRALIENLKEEYTIDYVVNSTSVEDVRSLVQEYRPNVLFTASMWSAEQSAEVQATAREIVPDIKFHAIPYGLQVEKGPEAIVEYLTEQVPKLLDS